MAFQIEQSDGENRRIRPDFSYTPPDGKLGIIYFDDHIIVLEKPAGLLTVPGKALEHRDCLESRIKEDFEDARVVHRLDMDTSGLIVLARNGMAHRHLGLQFERRHVEKRYQAVVAGKVLTSGGTVNLPLRCDWPNRPLQMVDFDQGRAAITDWKVLSYDADTTRVALYPKTGRSHQLRVHMLALGHPILGDRFYAQGEALEASDRLSLHADRLSFYHPDGGRWLTFESACSF